MNKETFMSILQCALFNFDGLTEAELIKMSGISPEVARLGVQLCSFLKSKEVKC